MTVQEIFDSGKNIRFCSEEEMDDFIVRYGEQYFWGTRSVSETKNAFWYTRMKQNFGQVFVEYNGDNTITGHWGNVSYERRIENSVDYATIHRYINLTYWEELMVC